MIDGTRYVVPGDRARITGDGLIELYGRDSVTINSGGEKIFAEEVEAAMKAHSAVYDCVVTGRPSERWGSEVVADRAASRWASSSTSTSVREDAARRIARYKLPKAIVVRRRDRALAVGQGRLPLGDDRRAPGLGVGRTT